MNIRIGSSLLLLFVLSGCADTTTWLTNDGALRFDALVGPDAGPKVYNDFVAPIIDPNLPSSVAADFSKIDPTTGSPDAPCLLTPQFGAAFPDNWLRPRFRWSSLPAGRVVELRLSADNQQRDLQVITAETEWTMPKDLWLALQAHSAGQPLTLSIRQGSLLNGQLSGVSKAVSGPLTILPVSVDGALVYWSTTSSSLYGFSIGDEGSSLVVQPSNVKQRSLTCVGCHSGTPDGKYAVVGSNAWSLALTRIDASDGAQLGDAAPFLSAAAKARIETRIIGLSTTSAAHWTAGDRVVIAETDDSNNLGLNGQLVWFDLEAASAGRASGVLARNGDQRQASSPHWSHDGKTIVYTSTQDPRHGTPHATNGDIYTIPYNDRAGGQARPLPGASDPQRNEYYPSFSPDDKWVAFNAANDDKSYSNPNAEVYIIPSSGGTPTRLKANDGPSCAPFSSPGIANSFPKWAPFASTIGNYSYYFLTFSSTRFGSNSQIFVAPIVVHQDEVSTTVTTYPALHLWNQGSEANHTPIWEKLRIPIVK